jgi:OmpA-OmpF porin, OOP family
MVFCPADTAGAPRPSLRLPGVTMSVTMRILAAVLCAALCAQGKTLRVPSEYKMIGAALHAANEGDTILLARGFYRESVELIDGVALKGELRDSTSIIGSERRPVIRGANKSVVRDLTVKGGSVGIRCENKQMLIENCVITENRETGIHCLVSLPDIRSNIIVRNDWTGIFCESSPGLNSRIEHNIIAENSYSGIMLQGKSELIVQDNILCNNGQYAIWASKESRRARIEYNNFYNNRHTGNQFVYVNSSNLTLDPAFEAVRADVYNYALPPRRSFKQMGKDGSDVGLLSAAQLKAAAGDKDRDNVEDDVDQCPGVAEDLDGFQDDDGCPEFDNDNDGIYDSRDACDEEAEDVDGFQDTDGCPDPDNDGDKVPDSLDACPDKPETVNGYKDDDGCPDEKPAE